MYDIRDDKGVRHLLNQIDSSQHQLAQIPKRDGQGNIILDENGNPKNHKKDEHEIRGIVMNRIGQNGNHHFEFLKNTLTGRPHITYAELRQEIEHILNRGEDFDYVPQARKLAVSSTEVIDVAQDDRKKLIACLNCKRNGHYVSDCKSSKCFACNRMFKSPEERYVHGREVHGKKGNRKDNNRDRRSRSRSRERDRSRSRSRDRNNHSSSPYPNRQLRFDNSGDRQPSVAARRAMIQHIVTDPVLRAELKQELKDMESQYL
jgi:hypothetical protein